MSNSLDDAHGPSLLPCHGTALANDTSTKPQSRAPVERCQPIAHSSASTAAGALPPSCTLRLPLPVVAWSCARRRRECVFDRESGRLVASASHLDRRGARDRRAVVYNHAKRRRGWEVQHKPPHLRRAAAHPAAVRGSDLSARPQRPVTTAVCPAQAVPRRWVQPRPGRDVADVGVAAHGWHCCGGLDVGAEAVVAEADAGVDRVRVAGAERVRAGGVEVGGCRADAVRVSETESATDRDSITLSRLRLAMMLQPELFRTSLW